MVPPRSDFFELQDVPDAGRGLLARQTIPQLTLLLSSPGPAAHVIFRQYRKEVCAQCFHYDRGRTLPVRDGATGKVFCTAECQSRWLEENGELGLEAWRRVEAVAKAHSRGAAGLVSDLSIAPQPNGVLVDSMWDRAREVASLKPRTTSLPASKPASGAAKAEKAFQKAARQAFAQYVDADVLGYLLSAVLLHHQRPDVWEEDVMVLAMDPTPYRTSSDLEAHCTAFLQLHSVLPDELISSCTPSVCRTIANAGNHNAFGIRSGGEDNEEYMGYSIYPEASYFNHSCAPNVSKERVGREWRFRAAREIEEDEQLCISYLGGDERDMTVSERRSRLKTVWDFTCACMLCVQDSGEG